jgi:hypothetical protein
MGSHLLQCAFAAIRSPGGPKTELVRPAAEVGCPMQPRVGAEDRPAFMADHGSLPARFKSEELRILKNAALELGDHLSS